MLGRCGRVTDSFTRFYLLALQQQTEQEVFEISGGRKILVSLAAVMNHKKPNKHTPSVCKHPVEY